MVRHEIQTNGTLINRQLCELFTTYGFEVGVSIDGPGALNRNRLDRAGNPTTPEPCAACRPWPKRGSRAR